MLLFDRIAVARKTTKDEITTWDKDLPHSAVCAAEIAVLYTYVGFTIIKNRWGKSMWDIPADKLALIHYLIKEDKRIGEFVNGESE